MALVAFATTFGIGMCAVTDKIKTREVATELSSHERCRHDADTCSAPAHSAKNTQQRRHHQSEGVSMYRVALQPPRASVAATTRSNVLVVHQSAQQLWFSIAVWLSMRRSLSTLPFFGSSTVPKQAIAMSSATLRWDKMRGGNLCQFAWSGGCSICAQRYEGVRRGQQQFTCHL